MVSYSIPKNIFLERIKNRVGQGYVWSNYFSKVTSLATIEATRQKALSFSGSNPFKSDGNNGRTYAKRCKKWIGKYAGDCSGMIKAAWWEDDNGVVRYEYKDLPDVNVSGMMQLSKKIGYVVSNFVPERPGIAVSYPGHVGVYIGNGKVVEARGVDYGVVVTNIKDRPWVNWFEIPFVDYSIQEESDIMLKTGDSGLPVYDYQTACKEAGYYIGVWANMKDADIKDGRDGEFGPFMESVTKEAQREFSLPVTGYVDAATYGRIVAKAFGKIANEPVVPKEIKVGSTVIVNGRGWAASDKTGNRTRVAYNDQEMIVDRINDGSTAPYLLKIGTRIIGWFDKTQVK